VSDIGFPNVPTDGTPEPAGFVVGYAEAERQFYEQDDQGNPPFANPFREGTDQHRGFEEAVYDFTQK
jgi:hypothetical protein